VLRAFELRAEGWPFQRIAERLNERAPGRADGRPWTATSVERMIRRRVYRGIAHWGEHENRRAHPALVSEELWHAARARAAGDPDRRAPRADSLERPGTRRPSRRQQGQRHH
jgi:L-alanine-DL-glutamate epimerase-like enolase superfamily enzyme